MHRAPLFLPLLWTVLPPCAGGEVKELQDVAPAITVYAQFDKDHSVLSVEQMKAELDAIMRPIGLQFEWRSLQATRGSDVAVELVVVSFKGTCKVEDMRNVGKESGALGWTHLSDGDVLPFSDIHCDRIRSFIQPHLAALDREDRERAFGRALGRILAHELYHVFSKTTRHAAWGVAKAFYTPGELVADHFRFEERESRDLRDGKVKSLLRRRDPAAGAFGAAGQ